MVFFGCAFDMMLMWVSAIITLELMTLSIGLGGPVAPKTTPCPLNVQISLIVDSIFQISAIYGLFWLCFRYDADVGLCYHIFRAHGPITEFRAPCGTFKLPQTS